MRSSQSERQVYVVVNDRHVLLFLLQENVEPVDLVRIGARAATDYADLQQHSSPATRAMERAGEHLLAGLDGREHRHPVACLSDVFYALSLSPLRDRLFSSFSRLRVDLMFGGERLSCRLWDDADWELAPHLPAAERIVTISPTDLS